MASSQSLDLHESHKDITDLIQRNMHTLTQKGTDTNLYWVAGHVQLEPNELADDRVAKSAAENVIPLENSLVSITTLKGEIKTTVYKKWQRSWNIINEPIHKLFPDLPKSIARFKSVHHRIADSRFIRTATSHSRLNDHMFKLKLSLWLSSTKYTYLL